MALFNTIRVVSFATVLFFSLIVLGISGHWVSLLQGLASTDNNPSGFALAVSVITLASIAPVLFISILRKGSFLSWVVVELGIVAVAAYVASLNKGDTTPSSEYQAHQAFSWLNWIILNTYLVLLSVFAIKAQHKGHNVWTSDVTDVYSFASGGGSTNNLAPVQQQNTQYSPSIQQSYVHPNFAQSQYGQPGVAQV